MNRIIILSVLLFIISCTKTTADLSKESNQTNSTQSASTPSPKNNIDNNSRVIDNHIHKKETRYYHSGGSGSVIITTTSSNY